MKRVLCCVVLSVCLRVSGSSWRAGEPLASSGLRAQGSGRISSTVSSFFSYIVGGVDGAAYNYRVCNGSHNS